MRHRIPLAVALLSAMVGGSEPAAAGIWPTTHQRITANLSGGDVTERRAAVAKLLTLPPKLARTLAKKALSDPDIEVQLMAARAAIALGVQGAGEEVKEWLSARDVRLRVAACELIEASPTRDSLQSLARVLGDAQPNVRRVAASAMGASGSREAVAPLLGHLDDASPEVRLEVVRALGRLGDERAVVPLVSKLQDQESAVRREAARALGQLGDARATATLVIALQDPSLGVQVDALAALGALRASDAVTAIAALFADADPSARLGARLARGPVHDAALRALGDIGSPQAVKLLIEALEREGPVDYNGGDSPVRDAMVRAGKPAAQALQLALETSTSQRLASSAALALGQAHAAGAASLVTRAMQRGGVHLNAGLDALAALGDKTALPFVLEQLDTQDPALRRQVIRAAVKLLAPDDHDGRVVDVVAERARDPGVPIGERVALVRLLGRSGSPRAQKLLLSLASSKPIVLRVGVMAALGTLGVGGPEVDAVLLKALADPELQLRLAASHALAQVGADAAAGQLLQRLGEAAEQDRAAVGLALSGALSRSHDAKLVATIDKLAEASTAGSRDALIEGLGRMPSKEAGALLARLRKGADPDDRRKVAEALAGHPDQAGTLRELLRDVDPGVRANAAWALGRLPQARQQGNDTVTALSKALRDIDVAVAGNAASALGLSASAAQSQPAATALCGALDDFRSYVRAGALAGLRELGRDCPADRIAQILRRDNSWRVRLNAASLIHHLIRDPAATPERRATLKSALFRCQADERNATVARRCIRAQAPVTERSSGVLIYIVPEAKQLPQPRAPFALVLPDGNMRLGVADRRGAVFEIAPPAGSIELAVPAALAE